MRNSPLYICDNDEVYLEKLSKYIMKKKNSPFLVKTFSKTAFLETEHLSEGIFLISSSLIGEDTKALDAHRTIILNEGELKKSFAGFAAVNKFQPASVIYEKLLQCQMEREDIVCIGDAGRGKKKLKMIGVYSPVKRIGKSLFTAQMCSEESQSGKILKLSLEEFSKEAEEGAGLSEVIYLYRQKKLHMIFGAHDIIRHDKAYDYILPVQCPFDLRDMTSEDWVKLLEQIEEQGIYDSVWLDFDTMPPDMMLFERCEKIYVPYINTEDELRRILRFEKLLELMPEYNIQEKIVKVLMEVDAKHV